MGMLFVYALDSFRPGLVQVAVSSEPGDESPEFQRWGSLLAS
jgi:hypothetical protein